MGAFPVIDALASAPTLPIAAAICVAWAVPLLGLRARRRWRDIALDNMNHGVTVLRSRGTVKF